MALLQASMFKIAFDQRMFITIFILCFNLERLIDVQSPFYEINIDEFLREHQENWHGFQLAKTLIIFESTSS